MSVIQRPPMRVFFLGRDVVGVRHAPEGATAVFVTFDFLRTPKDKIFAYADYTLAELGYAHVHVYASWNHWYQTPEMDQLTEKVNAWTAPFERIVTMGASMGGFAALQFAQALNASAVLAGAPQFSVDPAKIPFDDRWFAYAQGLSFIYDDLLSRPLPTASYLAYDPASALDARHCETIVEATGARLLPCPGSGHAPIDWLGRLGLSNFVLASLAEHGRLDEAEFARRLQERLASGPPVPPLVAG